MGSRHARTIATQVVEASLVGLYDPDRARADGLSAELGAQSLRSEQQVIDDPGVDAVVVASPDPSHADLALRCMDAGKPVLVEKPLATSVEDARRVVERQRQLGKQLVQVGFMRRYDPAHLAVADAIRAGSIGRPLLFRGWHRNPLSDPRPSSLDVLVQSAVHDFHSARWLLDQEIVDVTVHGTPVDDATVPAQAAPDLDNLDLQVVTLRFDRGAIGVIEVNRNFGEGYQVGVEITGTAGMVTTAPLHQPVFSQDGKISQPLDVDWLDRFADAYRLEMQAWVHSLSGRGQPGPSAWDGYVTLAVAHAGHQSLATNRPVAVDFDPDLDTEHGAETGDPTTGRPDAT
jgi:myo-inositol 2-dehydrogenase/D-chiro-inositol 1-dehydrogenase